MGLNPFTTNSSRYFLCQSSHFRSPSISTKIKVVLEEGVRCELCHFLDHIIQHNPLIMIIHS
jgi:hypothetical protein